MQLLWQLLLSALLSPSSQWCSPPELSQRAKGTPGLSGCGAAGGYRLLADPARKSLLSPCGSVIPSWCSQLFSCMCAGCLFPGSLLLCSFHCAHNWRWHAYKMADHGHGTVSTDAEFTWCRRPPSSQAHPQYRVCCRNHFRRQDLSSLRRRARTARRSGCSSCRRQCRRQVRRRGRLAQSGRCRCLWMGRPCLIFWPATTRGRQAQRAAPCLPWARC